MNEELKTVKDNSPIILHECSLDIQKFNHMQRKFERDQGGTIHKEFLIPYHLFMDNTLHSMFAWFLMLEKILRLEFQHKVQGY